MERIKMPSGLRTSITWASERCDKHNMQLMLLNDIAVCPRCRLEEEEKALSHKVSEAYWKSKESEKYNTFRKSIIEDQTLLHARFENYLIECEEEQQNKALVLECVERYKRGETFNLILTGKQGTGKSHLAFSTVYDLNETRQYSCLFISVDAMLRKIKDSFGNKESKYTEEYFNTLLSSVDYLVLDDLGAETGAINTDKQATDFVQRVLYGVTNVRQDKSTILTTNLDSKTLFSMYDKKLVSRLLKNPKVVIFKESKDKRTSNMPF